MLRDGGTDANESAIVAAAEAGFCTGITEQLLLPVRRWLRPLKLSWIRLGSNTLYSNKGHRY